MPDNANVRSAVWLLHFGGHAEGPARGPWCPHCALFDNVARFLQEVMPGGA